MHLTLVLSVILPYRSGLLALTELNKNSGELFGGRDIIVNVNQDDRAILDQSTLLSDRDSTASGYVTRQQGDNWLNNALEFTTRRGNSAGSANAQATSAMTDRREIFVSQDVNQEYTIAFVHEVALGSMFQGDSGESDWQKIPDRKGITRDNALFFTNDGRFSYNTKKFKNFDYFRNMKGLIASNWFPPVGANSYLPERLNPLTGGYTPGYTRVNAIPSQEVRLYFTMDRSGRVLDVVILILWVTVRLMTRAAMPSSIQRALAKCRRIFRVRWS
jgi:hypothetical protein